MRDQIRKRSSNSSLWRQMGNIIAQYDGMNSIIIMLWLGYVIFRSSDVLTC